MQLAPHTSPPRPASRAARRRGSTGSGSRRRERGVRPNRPVLKAAHNRGAIVAVVVVVAQAARYSSCSASSGRPPEPMVAVDDRRSVRPRRRDAVVVARARRDVAQPVPHGAVHDAADGRVEQRLDFQRVRPRAVRARGRRRRERARRARGRDARLRDRRERRRGVVLARGHEAPRGNGRHELGVGQRRRRRARRERWQRRGPRRSRPRRADEKGVAREKDDRRAEGSAREYSVAIAWSSRGAERPQLHPPLWARLLVELRLSGSPARAPAVEIDGL